MYSSLPIFKLKVEVRYNLPSSRGEICKFDLKTTVKEIKEAKQGDLFGPVQDEADENEKREQDENRNKKGGKGKGGKKGGKRCKKIKDKKERRRCKKKENNKDKDKGKGKDKKPPPKHQPVKSIHLKSCTR